LYNPTIALLLRNLTIAALMKPYLHLIFLDKTTLVESDNHQPSLLAGIPRQFLRLDNFNSVLTIFDVIGQF